MPKAKVEALIKVCARLILATVFGVRPLNGDCRVVQANGGKIAGSVTAAVTHVVAAELGTGKAEKAAEKGVPIACAAVCCALLSFVARAGLPVVKESWLQASIDAGKPVSDKKHMLTEGDGDE